MNFFQLTKIPKEYKDYLIEEFHELIILDEIKDIGDHGEVCHHAVIEITNDDLKCLNNDERFLGTWRVAYDTHDQEGIQWEDVDIFTKVKSKEVMHTIWVDHEENCNHDYRLHNGQVPKGWTQQRICNNCGNVKGEISELEGPIRDDYHKPFKQLSDANYVADYYRHYSFNMNTNKHDESIHVETTDGVIKCKVHRDINRNWVFKAI